MSNLTPNVNPINDNEVAAKAPVSEALLAKMGGNINALLASVLPLATTVESYLTELQFCEEIDDDINAPPTERKWVLADGREVIGTRYHAVTGEERVPDRRGNVARGKNNYRNDGKEDPAGERPLGHYQADELRSHRHSIQHPAAQGPIVGGEENYVVEPLVRTNPVYTDFTGGNETRMKNVAANFFIRIN